MSDAELYLWGMGMLGLMAGYLLGVAHISLRMRPLEGPWREVLHRATERLARWI